LDAEKADYKKLAGKKVDALKTKENGPLQPLIDLVPDNIMIAMSDGTKMIQVIFFALFFGIALAFIPKDKSDVVNKFCDGMNEVFIKMVNVVMMAAPFFVFCLMAGVLAQMANSPEEIWNIFASLSKYGILVVLGLAILLFGFYPLLLKVFGVKITFKEFFK